MKETVLGCIFTVFLALLTTSQGNPDAKRLYEDLLIKNSYNKLIRPVDNNTQTLTVYLGLKLSQLIDVDEKNQIMTTNVWLRQLWKDTNLKWDPNDYGEVGYIHIPATSLWLPDIVLFNNADGNYEVTLMTKATLHHTGKIIWEPPAIYKSSCQIDVEFFPFDQQECTMKFGSWTYDGFQVDLKHVMQVRNTGKPINVSVDYGMDLENFYQSVEWDVLKVPARRNEKYYPCCAEPYPDITFNITLRRKTLFYTVNLIIPCVAISFLTVLVFYLPSDSGEKITLCISVLLALTVFFLLLAEIIPPTSLVVPLIGKYLLFTMILVTLSIIVTVVVLNVHFRSPATHKMPQWVQKVFLDTLPRLLLMRRPNAQNNTENDSTKSDKQSTFSNHKTFDTECPNWLYSDFHTPYTGKREWKNLSFESFSNHIAKDTEHETPNDLEERKPYFFFHDNKKQDHSSDTWKKRTNYFKETDLGETAFARKNLKKALEGVRFIASHLKREDTETNIKEDWKFVAMVLDRLFLWIFSTACILGTMGIILQAPSLYDQNIALTEDNLPIKSQVSLLNEI